MHSGEIVGIAGISGNGQKEFVEVLAGQRPRDGGEVMVKGARLCARRRAEARALNVRFIPEEPLQQRLRAEDDGGREPRLPHLRRRATTASR